LTLEFFMIGKNKTPGGEARGQRESRLVRNSRHFSAPGRAANNEAANRANDGGGGGHEGGRGEKATTAFLSILFFRDDALGEQIQRDRVTPATPFLAMIPTTRFFFAIGALTVLAVTACQSRGPRDARGGGTGDAPMTASGELALPDPKPMDAQAAFFSGQIQVEAMLAKSDAVWKAAAPAEGGEQRGGGRGGFSGGFGGGGGGGGRRGSGGGGGRRGGGGDEGSAPVATDATSRAPTMRASNAPPIQLRLRLTSHGDHPIEVEVLDFNSELGNFAVQPAKITVLPHDSTEAGPMTSRLGVPAVEEIPLTVRLRVGGKGGQTETQVLKLRPRTDPTTPPAEPAAH
jgi:hypothetical protein